MREDPPARLVHSQPKTHQADLIPHHVHAKKNGPEVLNFGFTTAFYWIYYSGLLDLLQRSITDDARPNNAVLDEAREHPPARLVHSRRRDRHRDLPHAKRFTDVKRLWHTYDSHGQILALNFREKSLLLGYRCRNEFCRNRAVGDSGHGLQV